MKDVISMDQFDIQTIQKVLDKADKIYSELSKGNVLETLKGRVISLLFFEPSSRTFGSFTSAVKRLGGQTLEQQNLLRTSSVVKGESFEDTIKTFESYSDAIVIRHPEVGSAKGAADIAEIPVINAGDGPGEHPTQTLLDLYTIYKKFGRLNNLKGVLAGDLLNGRTTNSLIRGLSLYEGNTLYLLSPAELKIKKEILENIKNKIKIIEIESEDDMPEDCNFWYWTRVQKERFSSSDAYEKVKNKFIVTPQLLDSKGNRDMIIMHPLPRVGEISTEVDSDPRAYYIKHQMRNGLYIRMALLSLIFDL